MIYYIYALICPIPECADRLLPMSHPAFISDSVRYSIKCFPCPKVRLAYPPASKSSGSRWNVLAPNLPWGFPAIGPLQPYYFVETTCPKL